MNPPSTLSQTALQELLLRAHCPDCGGMLVHQLPGPPPESGDPVHCLDCARVFFFSDGVLDLRPSGWPDSQRVRLYSHQGKKLDFYNFYLVSLDTDAYKETDLEDDLYTLLGWLDPEPGLPLLMLGCGRGEFSRLLADALPASTIIAIDDELDVLRDAELQAREQGFKRILHVLCDLERPPFRAGSFETAMHFGLLHGFAENDEHIRALSRVIPYGGRLAGVTLALSTLESVAKKQLGKGTKVGVNFVHMQALGKDLIRAGWDKFRHEQPSHWMARFRATRDSR